MDKKKGKTWRREEDRAVRRNQGETGGRGAESARPTWPLSKGLSQSKIIYKKPEEAIPRESAPTEAMLLRECQGMSTLSYKDLVLS